MPAAEEKVHDPPRPTAKYATATVRWEKNRGRKDCCGTLISHGFLRSVKTAVTAGGGLPLQATGGSPDVAVLRGPARNNTRTIAAFMAAIALAAITRTANMEEAAA